MTETIQHTVTKNSLKKFFNYQWITGNMNFILFLNILIILYISNGHVADRTIRNINKTQNELKELQYQYKSVKSDVMYRSEEEQVLKAAIPLGLKISNEIPTTIQSIKK
jgi:hypothetical protein